MIYGKSKWEKGTNLVVLLPLCPLPVAAAGTARPLAVVAVPALSPAASVAVSFAPLAGRMVAVVARVVLVALSGVAARPEIVGWHYSLVQET